MSDTTFRLIINADDFGLSESVNQAIADSFRKGYITNTTLMVNMPYANQAVELAKKEGFWDRVGLHLNLYEGIPMNKKLLTFSEILCDENNELKYWSHGINRFCVPKELGIELGKEIELQINKFISYNPVCMHADSHGHSHTNWSVWKECKPLFKKYGIQSTRAARNLYVAPRMGFKDVYKKLYNRNIERSGLYITDWFGSFSDMKDILENVPEMINGDTVELMCHPNYKNHKLITDISVGIEDMFPLLTGAEWSKY